MGKSQELRSRDVRGVERLVGECQDLWHDAAAWRTRMFEGLCDLTGAQCGMGGERSGMLIGQDRTLQTVTYRVTPEAFQLFQHFLARGDPTIDIPFWRFQQTLTKRVVTADQQQFVTAREWRRSEIYNEYSRPCGFEYRLMSCHQLPCAPCAPGDSLHHGFVLYRLRGEKPFGERELRIAHHFNRLCGPLIGSALASVAGDPLAVLPPRVGQTLMLLLGGASEKQAAARMGISRHTVHDYTKQLHWRFGVSHQRELLVRCRALTLRARAMPDSAENAAVMETIETLPPRAQETLRLLLRGHSESDIARSMRISPHTVGDYVKRVYAGLAVSSRAELFVRCQAFVRVSLSV